MLWGCFESFVTGKVQCVEGKMYSFLYQEILGENDMLYVRKLKLGVIGPSNRKMVQSIPQIPPRLGCRRNPGRSYSGHHTHLT